jgi:hypothetical protein
MIELVWLKLHRGRCGIFNSNHFHLLFLSGLYTGEHTSQELEGMEEELVYFATLLVWGIY